MKSSCTCPSGGSATCIGPRHVQSKDPYQRLKVDFISMTDPGVYHTGHVLKVIPTAEPHEEHGNMVRIRVQPDAGLVNPRPARPLRRTFTAAVLRAMGQAARSLEMARSQPGDVLRVSVSGSPWDRTTARLRRRSRRRAGRQTPRGGLQEARSRESLGQDVPGRAWERERCTQE